MHEHAGRRTGSATRAARALRGRPEHWLKAGPSLAAMSAPLPAPLPPRRPRRVRLPHGPEVLETKPGPCRICGMALEPRTVTLADERNPELEDMTRRFRVALALTAPLLALAMGAMLPGHLVHRFLSRGRRASSSSSSHPRGALGRMAVLPAHVAQLPHRHLNMFTLIGIGTGIAWLYSLAAVLVPGPSPSPSESTTARSAATSSRRR